jgi:glycosyltransferase involved in cell wall biosynthesis
VKVLQINSVCGIGSTGRIAADLYKVLEEQGHECFIAYGRGIAPEGIKTIKTGSDFSVNIHGVLSRITDKHGFYSTAATKKFIEQVKEYDPDVIHLHNIHGYYINIELLFHYLRETNKPVVWTLHDCWAFTGHCAHLDYVGCDKWKNGCNKCPQKGSYPSSLLFDNSKFNYLKKKKLFTSINNMSIVTPSKWLAGLVELSYLGKYPVKVINNGIDLDVFKPTPSNFREKYNLEDKFVILGVASGWVIRKGLANFIELSKTLDDKYKIVLVGLSAKQVNEIPQNIIGIIRTNNVKELAEIYTAADVFVNPSVEETMGLVTVEALACGTPTIVYNATAVPEMVDETCGLVVEKGNVEELVKAIAKCKNNNFSSDSCIERARLYDKEQKAVEYINTYNEGKK